MCLNFLLLEYHETCIFPILIFEAIPSAVSLRGEHVYVYVWPEAKVQNICFQSCRSKVNVSFTLNSNTKLLSLYRTYFCVVEKEYMLLFVDEI